mgnify:FL=1
MIVVLLVFFLIFNFNQVYAHLAHVPHYNGGSNRDSVGKYYPYMALDPEYTKSNELTQITFSIQDFDGNDVRNIETMIEIYEETTGNRIKAFPWTLHDTGDFELYYIFPHVGNYQIVLSVANDDRNVNHNMVDPPRSILGSDFGCDCGRVIFNISVSNTWGEIRNSLFAIAVAAPISTLGFILGISYYKKRKLHVKYKSKEDLRYAVMLLAIAGGLVHLAIFPEHGSLQIYYSVFLLAAATAQVAYGIMYILVNLGVDLDEYSDKQMVQNYYRKAVTINLFGLFGTAVLVGLYTYSVIFPPPLSPTNTPETVDIAGILAKSLEVLLIIGIVSLMIWEKKRVQSLLIRARP